MNVITAKNLKLPNSKELLAKLERDRLERLKSKSTIDSLANQSASFHAENKVPIQSNSSIDSIDSKEEEISFWKIFCSKFCRINCIKDEDEGQTASENQRGK
ncbi:unnamed protein product [Blepharisma stoltei]|uniref:Uncharacterized protein n=1 Tax=Blepharisma stoltei TaxID=1481888 RepID=A0AAU9KDI5_9CILI|nr:unnamed protein product [Blepharisma stoltei]